MTYGIAVCEVVKQATGEFTNGRVKLAQTVLRNAGRYFHNGCGRPETAEGGRILDRIGDRSGLGHCVSTRSDDVRQKMKDGDEFRVAERSGMRASHAE
jgi:hypothetical protein